MLILTYFLNILYASVKYLYYKSIINIADVIGKILSKKIVKITDGLIAFQSLDIMTKHNTTITSDYIAYYLIINTAIYTLVDNRYELDNSKSKTEYYDEVRDSIFNNDNEVVKFIDNFVAKEMINPSKYSKTANKFLKLFNSKKDLNKIEKSYMAKGRQYQKILSSMKLKVDSFDREFEAITVTPNHIVRCIFTDMIIAILLKAFL